MKFDTTLFEKPIYKVNSNIKSHANDPFVRRKVAEAIEILDELERTSQKRKTELGG